MKFDIVDKKEAIVHGPYEEIVKAIEAMDKDDQAIIFTVESDDEYKRVSGGIRNYFEPGTIKFRKIDEGKHAITKVENVKINLR